jgi:RNA polymerase sigma factor (sigma-70 family)
MVLDDSAENKDLSALTPPMDLDEASLTREAWIIQQVRRGDKNAVITLYESHIDWVYRLVYSQVGNIAEAEALTTETFTQAIEALMNGQYPAQAKSFSAYVSAIANDILQERKRRLNNLPGIENVSQLLGPVEPDARKVAIPDTPVQKEEQAALWNLVKKLPVAEQQVLIMRHVYKLPYSEIARRLKRGEHASKQLHHRALTKLKRLVQGID